MMFGTCKPLLFAPGTNLQPYGVHSSHENLKRSMKNVGTLVKSTLGIQTINGVLTQKDVEVPLLGPKARRSTVDKVGALSSLRISVQQARPGEWEIVNSVGYHLKCIL